MVQTFLLLHAHMNFSLIVSLVSSSVVAVNFPRFYGHSHMTFEPLKNSYQTFQVTLEFKVNHYGDFLFSRWCLTFKKVERALKQFLCAAGGLRGRLVALLRRK